MVSEEPIIGPDDVTVNIDEVKKPEEVELICTFSFSLLKEIKELQNLHGLKHDDYQRYRQYCTRKLQRLYKGLKFLHGSKRFQNKMITPELFVKDIRYMQIIIMRAERAWAFAMDLKQFANTESRKQVALIGKLKKAVIYSRQLEELCTQLKCNTSTQLEAKAYYQFMLGMLYFEQTNWQKALLAFTSSQKIYDKLSGYCGRLKTWTTVHYCFQAQLRTIFLLLRVVDDPTVYQAKHEEMMPNKQYCLYNIQSMGIDKLEGEEGEILMKELDNMIASKAKQPVVKARDIQWENNTTTISSDELKILLAKIEDNISQVKECSCGDKKLEYYEDIASSCRDAVAMVKKDDKIDKKDFLVDYFTYLRLTNTINRFLLMSKQVSDKLIGVVETRPGTKVARPEDLVRLYDIILQNYADVKDINSLDKDGNTYKMIEVNTLHYRTKRCFYIAECHLAMSNWLNAIVLYDKCSEHIEQTKHATKSATSEQAKAIKQELDDLSKQIYSQRCSAHASAFLSKQLNEEELKTIAATANGEKKLEDCLNEFSIITNVNDIPKLAALPPAFQTIPCKPTFFDISLNHIEFPDLEHRVEKGGSGFSGLTKWLWGR